MTILTFLEDAMRLIGVLSSTETSSPEDSALVLRVVTEMVDEWGDDGVDVTWSPSAALDDECPLEGTEKTAVQYNLAVRICPHFEREPPSVVVAMANSSYAKLARNIMARATEPVSLSMPSSESGRAYYDIMRDE